MSDFLITCSQDSYNLAKDTQVEACMTTKDVKVEVGRTYCKSHPMDSEYTKFLVEKITWDPSRKIFWAHTAEKTSTSADSLEECRSEIPKS